MQTAELIVKDSISTAFEKENITEKLLLELKEKYSGITINGIEDTEGYELAKKANKELRSVQIKATQLCKIGREEAVKVQRLWIATEKDFNAKVDEIKNPIQSEIDRIEAEIEAKENARVDARMNKLSQYTQNAKRDYIAQLNDIDFEIELQTAKREFEKAESVRIELERLRAEQKVKDEEIYAMKKEVALGRLELLKPYTSELDLKDIINLDKAGFDDLLQFAKNKFIEKQAKEAELQTAIVELKNAPVTSAVSETAPVAPLITAKLLPYVSKLSFFYQLNNSQQEELIDVFTMFEADVKRAASL